MFGTSPTRKNKQERVGYDFEEVYQAVLGAQKAALAAIRPGVPAKEVDAAARRAQLRAGFSGGRLVFESRDEILAAVAEAMAEGSWQRLKACRADDCRWAFIDTARNRSRQWCDMAICGNREKARRFRSRHA